MKNRFKKTLAILLALMLIASLTACGGTTGGAPVDAATPSAADSSSEAPATGASGTQEVQLLTWANAPTVNFLNDLAGPFSTAFPDYTLVVTDVPQSEHEQVMQTRLSAGDIDILSFQQFSKPQEDWNESSMDMPSWQQYIEENLLLDLSGQAFLANYTEAALKANAYEGKNYSVPTGTVAYNGLFYNKTIFTELGLSVPNTWDEFIAACETIKADGKYQTITCGAADQWPLNMFANGILTSMYGDECLPLGKDLFLGNVKHTDEKMMNVYKVMDQFASYMEPGVTGVSYADVPGRFASGTIAMLADGAWQAPTIAAASPGFEFGYFPLPGMEARADGLTNQFGIKYDLAFAVAANSKNPNGSLAFLDFFSKKENYTAFLNAVGGFTPTQPDVTLKDAFLNDLSEGLKNPFVHAEHRMYAPKGVGEYGSNNGFSFFYLKTLGGPLSTEELAQKAAEDYQTARDALGTLSK